MFSAWRAMLKDLHELHAKYYKRLLYYKGMPCILDERGSNQMLSGFFSVRRICKEMPTDASIWPIKKWLFFHCFCRFLGRSQRWPLYDRDNADKDIAWTSIISIIPMINYFILFILYQQIHMYWPGLSQVSTYRRRPVLPTKCQKKNGAIVSGRSLIFNDRWCAYVTACSI